MSPAMMKSSTVRLCCAICVLLIPAFLFSPLLPSTAHAEDDWLFAPYLRADLGYSIMVDDKAEFDDPIERDSIEMTSHKGPQQMTIVTRMASRTKQAINSTVAPSRRATGRR